MANEAKKTVLITGCSAGGIGSAMAEAFLQRGYYVFATARAPFKIELASFNNVETIKLDVTSHASIIRAKEIVAKSTDGRLDVLVSNAGIENNCPLLDTDMTEARNLFDVNFWGSLAMAKKFSPLLIKARGIICNQSSIDAALTAWAGIFASSKAAVARMSETMRVELEPLGVRVITSMCGSADTPMLVKPGGPMVLSKQSHYRGVEDAAWKE